MDNLAQLPECIDLRVGDCIPGLASIADRSIDAVFADPPYNIGETEDRRTHYNINAALEAQNWTPFFAGWDAEWADPMAYIMWAFQWLTHCKRILKRKGSIFITGTYHCIGEISIALKLLGFYTVRWISWHNPIAMPNRTVTSPTAATQIMIWARPYEQHTHIYHKDVAMLYGGGVNLDDTWSIQQNVALAGRLRRKGIEHPSKKPPALIERALRLSVPRLGAVVVDPFAGSGTTGDVVRSMGPYGWRCILFEKDATYIPMMHKRFAIPVQTMLIA